MKRKQEAAGREKAEHPATDINFASRLPAAHRAELEALLFFHPRQSRVFPGIVESVEKYGHPRIVEEAGYLRVSVGESAEVQNLYALVRRREKAELAGALVYTRADRETLVLLHIAVKDEYSLSGRHSHQMLTMKLLAKLQEIALQIKGVRFLVVVYGKGLMKKMPVRAGTAG